MANEFKIPVLFKVEPDFTDFRRRAREDYDADTPGGQAIKKGQAHIVLTGRIGPNIANVRMTIEDYEKAGYRPNLEELIERAKVKSEEAARKYQAKKAAKAQ